MRETAPRSVVLFDGVCGFCAWSVRFILKRDPGARFAFAPLQSDLGVRMLEQRGLAPGRLDTLVLVEDTVWWTRSSAALRIARHLSGAWPLAYALVIVPSGIRDVLYDWLARNRYRWFGRLDECLVPTPDQRERFLVD